MIIGIVLPTTLCLYRFVVPVLSRWAMSSSYDHTSAEVWRAYAVRVPPLLAIYFVVGFVCTMLVDSTKTASWALLIVAIAVLCSLLFQSLSLSGRVPFRHEVELQLPIFIPMVGALLGCGLAWFRIRRGRERI